MAEFACQECGKAFEVGADKLEKFPGWTPRFCMSHRASAKAKPTSGTPAKAPSDAAPAVQRLPPGNAAGSKTFRSSGGSTVDLSPDEVLARYTSGPTTGVFTDGGARPNPGPGGWGFVYVEDGKIMAEGAGGDRKTTNNRMEMSAIIAALEHLPTDARVTIFSDSDLCVKTLTIWAKSWAAKGWRRKEGEIKNLDLVQRAYELARAHPGVKLQWIKAHDGSRWNEYVDALATRALKHL
jgi:ribonuclease HI